jgi:hypothetical protein
LEAVHSDKGGGHRSVRGEGEVMGTRGVVGFRLDNKDILFYNHYDSYPSGLGWNVVQFVQRVKNWPLVKERVRGLRLVDEDGPMTQADTEHYGNLCGHFSKKHFYPYTEHTAENCICDWHNLLHNLQGKLADILDAGIAVKSNDFVKNSLFCEWGWIINLDGMMIEVYRGFQTKKGKGRFNRGVILPTAHDDYFPISLKCKWGITPMAGGNGFGKITRDDLIEMENKFYESEQNQEK